MLEGLGFYQYDRISLAEAVIEPVGDRLRPSTFLEFRKRYESAAVTEQDWLAPAQEVVAGLSKDRMAELQKALREIDLRIAEHTKMPSPLADLT
jgi:hypothetical protein